MERHLGPTRTPPEVCARLNREIVAVLKAPEVRTLFEQEGADAVGSSGPEFDALIKSETAKWAKVIKYAQIRTE